MQLMALRARLSRTAWRLEDIGMALSIVDDKSKPPQGSDLKRTLGCVDNKIGCTIETVQKLPSWN